MTGQDVVIIGAGGHGSEVHSYLHDLVNAGQPLRLVGFIDDRLPVGPLLGSEILGGLSALRQIGTERDILHYITAFGDNPTRRKIVEKLAALQISALRPWTLRHPTANIGYEVEIGDGTLLAPGVIVTTRVRVGRHCILNVKASVSHDCKIGDFVNINPGATICGDVAIGDGSFIGAGAVVKERITIGQGVLVGAGAVVVKDVPDRAKVVGVPATVVGKDAIAWRK
jgi:sugar O-acyltransferase (sialic acid O-acetyltransferase NeuD family)